MTSRSPKTLRTLRADPKKSGGALRKTKSGNGAGLPQKRLRSRSNYVLEEQVGFQLRLAMQRHTAIFVANMVLTQTQFATIAKLNDVGPCSQNHLARLVALDAATINGVLDRLRKRGYVSTEPDLRDARQRVIAVTPAGRRIVEQATKIAKQVTEETLLPLSKAERAQLSQLLTRIS
jgi:MarR family transcriptional regulator, lower aerobic nicotinate degradation pathway regulator